MVELLQMSSALRSRPRRGRARGVALALLSIAAAAAQAASYRVYPLPVGSPDHGARVLLTNPHNAAASPFGWHDTNGAAGAEHTILRGNNAWVYVDADNNHTADGPGPDGGAGLVFDHPFAPASDPTTYTQALATNAFYLGNLLHDILWHHGFREADGNFQENTYGNGGLGGDAMRIEILNGLNQNNFNNATFLRTADGTPPRIEMYVWNSTTPRRESSFDAGVLAWAYMQVAQGRLQPGCALSNAENPQIGYADFFGTWVSNNFAATAPATPRGLGTYVLGQPVTGQGIRTHPYSVDMTVNPLTYANSPGTTLHGLGTIYATMLWDLTWRLVELDGASNNLVTGNGGENRALRLVIQALKLQPCAAGLVDARDALLEANALLYGGADECKIWNVFARRGLGASASQGSTATLADNIAGFDLPEPCGDAIFADGFESPPSPPSYTAFCWSGGSIQIPAGQPGATSGPASIYPVPVTVSGIASPIEHIRLRLQGLTHTYPGDIDVLMVGPQGQKFIAQSDAGSEFDVSAITYDIEDAAPTLLPSSMSLASGTYRPANHVAGDTFAAPAPAAPYVSPIPVGSATLNGTYAGSNANGTWNIYIVDDEGQDVGSLTGLCVDISPQ